MKKNTILILGAVAVGAYLLIAMRKKRSAYKIDVPAPEKITEEEFEKSSASKTFAQKVSPIVQSIFKSNPIKKMARKEKRAAKKASKKVGEFPDMC